MKNFILLKHLIKFLHWIASKLILIVAYVLACIFLIILGIDYLLSKLLTSKDFDRLHSLIND